MYLDIWKLKHSDFYLIRNLNLSKNKYERWRKTAEALKLSRLAKQRLEWIIFYHTKADKNASLTCRHFGITRSKWYFWFSRFNQKKFLGACPGVIHWRKSKNFRNKLHRSDKEKTKRIHPLSIWKSGKIKKTIYQIRKRKDLEKILRILSSR